MMFKNYLKKTKWHNLVKFKQITYCYYYKSRKVNLQCIFSLNTKLTRVELQKLIYCNDSIVIFLCNSYTKYISYRPWSNLEYKNNSKSKTILFLNTKQRFSLKPIKRGEQCFQHACFSFPNYFDVWSCDKDPAISLKTIYSPIEFLILVCKKSLWFLKLTSKLWLDA